MCETIDIIESGIAVEETPVPEKQGIAPRRKYQTRINAGPVDTIIPEMVIPTSARNLTAFSLTDQKDASHLIPVSTDIDIEYVDHALRLNGSSVYNTKGIESYLRPDISDIDVRLLRIIYGAIVQKMRPLLDNRTWDADAIDTFGLRVFLPDLISVMGYTDRRKVAKVYAQLESYQYIIGLYAPERGHQTLQPALLLRDRDEKTNTVSLVSPYLNRIVLDAYLSSLQNNTRRKLLATDMGIPIRKPTDSYLVRATIASEKNKRAAEIVATLVTLIEQAGEKSPHIKASTIVSRQAELQVALNSAKTNNQRNVLLHRAFSAAWTMLLHSGHTKIDELYKSFSVESYYNDGHKEKTVSYAGLIDDKADTIDTKQLITVMNPDNEDYGPEPPSEHEDYGSFEHNVDSVSVSDYPDPESVHDVSGDGKSSRLKCTIPPSPTISTMDSLIYVIRHGKKNAEARGLKAAGSTKRGRTTARKGETHFR